MGINPVGKIMTGSVKMLRKRPWRKHLLGHGG